MSSSTSASASSVYDTITVGRSSNAIDLLVPKAPQVQAAPELKAQVFDFLSDLLLEHQAMFSSAELIAAYQHIPGNSYTAVQEASIICRSIRSSFFDISNLQGMGFRDITGADVASGSITNDVSLRPPGLLYFGFRSTVVASDIDRRIVTPAYTVEFLLALPQITATQATTSANTTPT